MRGNIPYNLIREAVDADRLGTLAYWFRLKNVFKNPVFYGYTSRCIAAHLGCSTATAAKHVRRMIEYGWATVHHGNLCLVGTNKLNTTFVIKVPVADSKTKQQHYLRYAMLRNNIDYQKKTIREKTELVTIAKTEHLRMSKKQIRKIRQAGGVEKFEKSINPKVTLSNLKIGRVLNRSQATGKRYQHALNALGTIRSYPSFKETVYDPFYDVLGRITQSRSNGKWYYQTSNMIIAMQ